jgi:hypothetical protein
MTWHVLVDVQEPMLLVTVSITLQQQQQQRQQQQQQRNVSPSRPCPVMSGRQRVQLLTGLAQLAGVSRLAVGFTQVIMQQQQQQQQQQAACAAPGVMAAAGVASLTCTVSAMMGAAGCHKPAAVFCCCFKNVCSRAHSACCTSIR